MEFALRWIFLLAPFVSSAHGAYKLVFEEQFNGLELNNERWEHEITAWGGGNGEFQVYTDDKTNTYVKGNTLFIKPTPLVNNTNPLTRQPFGESFLTSGVLNLTAMYGKCTFSQFNGCLRTGSASHIILPMMSGRIRTRERFSFKFGKLEVVAKMPVGDWLWPAVWLLPEDEVYGGWPRSGEIDLVESRGNRNLTCGGKAAGVDMMGSALHWGPRWDVNRYPLTHDTKQNLTTSYGDGYHVYLLDWDKNGLRFFVDGHQIMKVPDPLINENENWNGFWEFGKQGGGYKNGSGGNPWVNGSNLAPFDQKFHLIVNVAVGGTGGYFPNDCVSNGVPIPWNTSSADAPSDFWDSRDQWMTTWQGENAALKVKSIKVWQDVETPTRTSPKPTGPVDSSKVLSASWGVLGIFALSISFQLLFQ